jgi:hypothetical protein
VYPILVEEAKLSLMWVVVVLWMNVHEGLDDYLPVGLIGRSSNALPTAGCWLLLVDGAYIEQMCAAVST